MEKFKGTKGKWNRYSASLIGNDTKATHSVYVGTKRIALCYDLFETDKSKNVEEKEAEANAKLIASAPLLLSDLNDLVWLIENGATQEELEERIKTSKKLITKIIE